MKVNTIFIIFVGILSSSIWSQKIIQEQHLIEFTLSDTTEYESVVYDGKYGLLFVNRLFIDSVDIDFWGIKRIDDYLIYQTFTPQKNEFFQAEKPMGYKSGYKIYNPVDKRKKELDEILPDFNNYFSSPNIIENKLYYWGLKKGKSDSKHHIYAIKYDFFTASIDSIYLHSDYLETDDPWYFFHPTIQGEQLDFYSGWKSWRVDFNKNNKEEITDKMSN